MRGGPGGSTQAARIRDARGPYAESTSSIA